LTTSFPEPRVADTRPTTSWFAVVPATSGREIMMSGKFTPGPWEVRDETVGNRIVRRLVHDHNRSGRGYKPIATLHAGFTCSEADARLIAAAPDLADRVEALEGLLRECEWVDFDGDDADAHPQICQVCLNFEPDGHAPGCRLAAALGKGKGVSDGNV
jgi:hypothetical protein